MFCRYREEGQGRELGHRGVHLGTVNGPVQKDAVGNTWKSGTWFWSCLNVIMPRSLGFTFLMGRVGKDETLKRFQEGRVLTADVLPGVCKFC